MPDYSKAKIYQIVCNETGRVYIGSTCEPSLSRRLSQHVRDYENHLRGNKHYVTSFLIIKNMNYAIGLIENCKEVTNRDELRARERYYIQNCVCVNKNIPGRTRKQHYDENKESIKEYKSQYYLDNKERLTKKYQCECGGCYSHANKSIHLKTKKHQQYCLVANL